MQGAKEHHLAIIFTSAVTDHEASDAAVTVPAPATAAGAVPAVPACDRPPSLPAAGRTCHGSACARARP